VAISSAGGLVARLFDLRGKVSKPELEEFVRSVGVKRVGAGKEILKQGARDDRRLYVVRQGRCASWSTTATTSMCWPRWGPARSSAKRPA
jgi:subfamily B ATP-binding cassette protein HlyB/CyaB